MSNIIIRIVHKFGIKHKRRERRKKGKGKMSRNIGDRVLINYRWKQPSKTWSGIPLDIRRHAESYNSVEVYEKEDGASLHDQVQTASNTLNKWLGKDTSIGAAKLMNEEDLTTLLKQIADKRRTKIGETKVEFNEENRLMILLVMANLAKTDPEKTAIGIKAKEKQGHLVSSLMTVWWAAATNTLGCQYPKIKAPNNTPNQQQPLKFVSPKTTKTSPNKTNNKERKSSLKQHNTNNAETPLKRSRVTIAETTSESEDDDSFQDSKPKAIPTTHKGNTNSQSQNTIQATGKRTTARTLSSDSQDSDSSSEQSDAKPAKPGRRRVAAVKPNSRGNSNINGQTTLTRPERTFCERYDIKITLPDEDEGPITLLHQCIQEWFEEIKLVDETAILLPWANKNKHEYIDSIDAIPKQLQKLRAYFQSINPQTTGNKTAYGKIRIGSEINPEAITSGNNSEMGWWYNLHKHGLYKRTLADAEYTKDIGFLAYTGNFTKVDTTMKIINDAMKDAGFKHKIGGRVKQLERVSTETRNKYREEGGQWMLQPWVALSLEVDTKYARLAAKHLLNLFNNGNKKQPGGLNCRYVPNVSVASLGTKSREKIRYMIQKHKAVLKALQLVRIDGVVLLDTHDEQSEEKTLRQHIMDMRHASTGKNIFHSIDMTTSTLGETDVAFGTVMAEHEGEANTIATLLPAMCRNEINKSTNKWFTEEYNEISADFYFDEQAGEYKSMAQSQFDEVLDEEMGDNVLIIGLETMLNTERNENTSNENRSSDLSFTTFASDIGGPRNTIRNPNNQTGDTTTDNGNNNGNIHNKSTLGQNNHTQTLEDQIQELKQQITQLTDPTSSSTAGRLQ